MGVGVIWGELWGGGAFDDPSGSAGVAGVVSPKMKMSPFADATAIVYCRGRFDAADRRLPVCRPGIRWATVNLQLDSVTR